jgi:hypothetical protein
MPEEAAMSPTKEKRPPEQTQKGSPQREHDHHFDNVDAKRIPVLGRVRARLTYIAWYVRTLLSETRSLPHRMRVLSERMNHHAYQLELGPLTEEGPLGELRPCKATIGRTQCIESLTAKYPWISFGDVLLALDGWEMGSEYTRHSQDNENMPLGLAQENQYPLPFSR